MPASPPQDWRAFFCDSNLAVGVHTVTIMRYARILATSSALLLGMAVSGGAQGDKKDEKQDRGGQAPRQSAPQQRAPEAAPQRRQEAAPQRAEQSPQRSHEAAPQRAQQSAPGQSPQRAQEFPQRKSQDAAPQRAQQAPQRAPQSPQHGGAVNAPQAQQAHRGQQQQPERSRQQAQNWQQQRGWVQKGGGWQSHDTFQQSRARNWNSDHRDWGQRGGYGGSYIPQASFGVYFGSSHFFRIRTQPVMYMGYPRFAYGGYSFMMVDPYPEYWQPTWYDSDDVYIDFDNGYYLHDRRYPNVRLAITVAL